MSQGRKYSGVFIYDVIRGVVVLSHERANQGNERTQCQRGQPRDGMLLLNNCQQRKLLDFCLHFLSFLLNSNSSRNVTR